MASKAPVTRALTRRQIENAERNDSPANRAAIAKAAKGRNTSAGTPREPSVALVKRSEVEVAEQLTKVEAARLAELKAELQTVLLEGARAAKKAATLLLEISDKRLYRATHGTFEDFCETEFGIARQHGYRLIQFARVQQELTPVGVTVPNERTARALAPMVKKNAKAVPKLLADLGPKPTARMIEIEVTTRLRNAKPVVTVNPLEQGIARVEAAMERAVSAVRDLRPLWRQLLDGHLDRLMLIVGKATNTLQDIDGAPVRERLRREAEAWAIYKKQMEAYRAWQDRVKDLKGRVRFAIKSGDLEELKRYQAKLDALGVVKKPRKPRKGKEPVPATPGPDQPAWDLVNNSIKDLRFALHELQDRGYKVKPIEPFISKLKKKLPKPRKPRKEK